MTAAATLPPRFPMPRPSPRAPRDQLIIFFKKKKKKKKLKAEVVGGLPGPQRRGGPKEKRPRSGRPRSRLWSTASTPCGCRWRRGACRRSSRRALGRPRRLTGRCRPSRRPWSVPLGAPALTAVIAVAVDPTPQQVRVGQPADPPWYDSSVDGQSVPLSQLNVSAAGGRMKDGEGGLEGIRRGKCRLLGSVVRPARRQTGGGEHVHRG